VLVEELEPGLSNQSPPGSWLSVALDGILFDVISAMYM
jgi:hypothetical protein